MARLEVVLPRRFALVLIFVLWGCSTAPVDRDTSPQSATETEAPSGDVSEAVDNPLMGDVEEDTRGDEEAAEEGAGETSSRLDAFQRILNEAALLDTRQEYAAALDLIQQAMLDDPPDPLGPRFFVLRARVKQKLLRNCYLDAFVQFSGDTCTVGDIIEGEIIIMNISDEELTIPAKVEVSAPRNSDEALEAQKTATSQTMVRSEMTYREYLPSNTLVTNRRTRNFFVPKDIRLKKGETHRIPVTINTRDFNPGGIMYRSYELSCVLHAAEIRVGNEVFHGAITMRPGRIGVFPRNAEHLKKNPLRHMMAAEKKNSPVHLTLAAAWLKHIRVGDFNEAYEFLLGELERTDLTDNNAAGIMTSLMILSDLDEARSRENWITWLKEKAWTKKTATIRR